MKKSILLTAATAVIITVSCSRYIAPPCTSVDKIIKLKTGNSVTDINSALGIDPYDVYFLEEDGSMVITYNYRLKDRRMTVSGIGADTREKKIRSEEGNKDGEVWYQRSVQTLYVFIKDGKMKSCISDHGRSDAEYLLITNNNIEFISKNQLSSYGDKKIEVVPLGSSSRDDEGGGLLKRMRKGRNKSRKAGE